MQEKGGPKFFQSIQNFWVQVIIVRLPENIMYWIGWLGRQTFCTIHLPVV